MRPMDDLGRRRLLAREACGLTREDVARALGVTGLLVSHWERGARRPAEHVLERLAGILSVPLSRLFDEGGAVARADLAELLYRDANGDVDLEARAGLDDFIRFLDVYADLVERLGEPFAPMRRSP